MRSRNLAIVFAGICGYADRLGKQSWEQSQRMLRLHEALLDPAFRAFGGRRIKQIGGTFLVSFDSPTRSVLCAHALQGRVSEFNARAPAAERLEVRAGIHLGEVRIEHGDVFGDAVNIAARIESQAGPGEVLFGESVWLSMNRAGVRAEDLGPREFKGVPEPVRVFRLQRVRLPRGVDEALRELPSPERLEEAQSEVRGHLRDAMQAAMLRLEEAFPNVADRARLLLGAGLAAMAAVVVAVLLLIRLGGRP